MEVFVSALILTLVGVVIFTVAAMAADRRKQEQVDAAAGDLLRRALSSFPAYSGCPVVGGDSMLLIMDESERKALVALSGGFAKEIPFDDFTSVAINTNGYSVASTQKSGVVGRVIAGGMLGGGAGAVIGALTAKTVTSTAHETTLISVDVTVNDPELPLLSWIVFSPKTVIKSLKSYEVWPYMNEAVSIYNCFEPIFARHATAENGLVTI